MKTQRENLALRAHHFKRAAQEVFAEHEDKLARHHEVRDVPTYTKFRTATELGNARRIMKKAFAWAKNGRANKTEQSLIEMLLRKVAEYPERDQPRKNITFSTGEMELANTIGKRRLKQVLGKVLYIDLITSRHMANAIKGVRTGHFAEHFFWHGGTHARRLLTALIEKL